jgi:hypothetical protein
MNTIFRIVSALLLVTLVFQSCKKDIEATNESNYKQVAEFDHKVVWEWNEMLLQVERYAAGYRPGPISSAVGYINLAAYEACVPGMPEYNSIATRYAGLNIPKVNISQEYHWPTVVNKVHEVMLTRLFPIKGNGNDEITINFNKQVERIKELSARLESQYQEEVSDEVILRSRNHGEAVAIAVWDWWKNNNSVTFEKYNDLFGSYDWSTRTDEGRWEPTFPGPGKPLFPYWGEARTMAISDGQKICRPYTQYIGKYSEEPGSGIHNQAIEVLIQQTQELSYQSQWIGEFWSDDLLGLTFSPPLRFFAIADQVYNIENPSLETALFCNAKLGLAVHDAGIGAWNSKYYYNLLRPETYIKQLIKPDFEPILNSPGGDIGISPSFPAYPSGHATFGGASAAVLESVFGTYPMTDYCHKDRTEFEGYPRTFGSFQEMAQENSWSRVPLGVHYRCDADEGLRYGNEIGRTVNRLPWKK